MFGAGTILAGKFRVDRPLGQGGMGAVFAVTHLHLGQRVALKLLLEEMARSPAIVERFLREARASAQLRGDHVCRVSDVGTLENGAPYIVMELLEGRDLASLLATNGPLPPDVLCDYVLQACLGIAEAHARGIVHRDLKPANLFLAQRPDGSTLVKVLDFGIAKAPSDRAFDLTQTAAVMGSPGYMSPEQLRSTRSVDARSDIWALGTIVYELASGRTPFSGESITELAVRVSMDPTPPLPGHVPRELAGIVYRCLEKNPDHRFQELASFAAALAPFAGPRGHEMAAGIARLLNMSVPAIADVRAPATATTTLGVASGQLARAPRSKRSAALVAGLVGGALALVITAYFARTSKGPPASSAEANPPAPEDAATMIEARPTPAPIDAMPALVPLDATSVDAPPPDAAAPIDATPPRRPKPRTVRPRAGSAAPSEPTDNYDNSRF